MHNSPKQCFKTCDAVLLTLLQWQEARDALPDSIRVLEMTHDDSWLRDTAPTVGTNETQAHMFSESSRHRQTGHCHSLHCTALHSTCPTHTKLPSCTTVWHSACARQTTGCTRDKSILHNWA
jgi:hypothetical protein